MADLSLDLESKGNSQTYEQRIKQTITNYEPNNSKLNFFDKEFE